MAQTVEAKITVIELTKELSKRESISLYIYVAVVEANLGGDPVSEVRQGAKPRASAPW